MKTDKKSIMLRGMKDGIPIGLGYFAVAFSLGIIAKKAGLGPVLSFISSFFVRASAGEYGGYTLMAAQGTYMELVLMCIVTNLRYLLMSTALTQKFKPDMPLGMRLLTGTCITDEIFGISIAYPGYLEPIYTIGATLVAAPMWASGTCLGIILGSIMPIRFVSALSVALYGMFLAIIIPPAKKDRWVAVAVGVSFLLSYLCAKLPTLSSMSVGTRTIVLTIVISAVIAIIKPVEVTDDES